MNRKHIKRKRKGFTLIEILVVAVILGLLSAMLVPKISQKFGQAKHEIAKTKMNLVAGALEEFYLACGRFPSDAEGLDVLLDAEAPSGLEEKWTGPYRKESEITDPWGNRYMYFEEGMINAGSYDLVSYGADGQEGGEGENADIYND